MIGLIVFLVVVFLLAAGFSWLADQPGSLLILKFGGFEFAEENLAIIAAIAFAAFLAIVLFWILVAMVWKTPANIGSFFRNRRREKGWRAVSDGMIAVGSGDLRAARRAAKQSAKFLPEEPVSGLLAAQAAQMDGRRDAARAVFSSMLERPETKVLGLRGLFMEAEAAGERDAARHFVEEAAHARPGLEWSGKALLAMQAGEGDWEGALVTLHQNADAKLYARSEAKRLRAVLLTAHAAELESGAPQRAKEKALEAHRLAPELVPAAVISCRILARLGELRKAAKIVETCWKLAPHPDLMEVYTHVRSGDSGIDRLKRAEHLNSLRPNHPEGTMGVARARVDVQDWDGARAILAQLLKSAPTERVCLMMSEIEEGQHGDRGRVREWLSRAVRAPRDAAWTADGYIADEWAPLSPISGALDAFEWRVPSANSGDGRDLALEDIPPGPRDFPPAPAISAEKTDALPRAESDKSPKGEEAAKPPLNGAAPPAAHMETMPPPAQETSASARENENNGETKKGALRDSREDDGSRLESGDLIDAAGERGGGLETDPVDPIMKPPIDDPGPREDYETPRKRFKLF